MKLRRVDIRNFRSINESIVDFDPTCRVLVGINESGKSNILEALALLDRDRQPSRQTDLREALPNEDPIKESYVRFVFKFEKNDSEKLFNDINTRVLADSSNPEIVSLGTKRYRLRDACTANAEGLYTVDILSQSKRVQYWTFDPRLTLLKGWQKPTAACPADFETQISGESYKLKEHDFVRVKDLGEIPDNYLEPATIEDVTKLIGQKITDITTAELPVTIFWEYDENNLLPNSVDIQQFAANPHSCIPLENMFLLANVENIHSTLEEKRKLTPNQFQNFLNNVARKTTNHFRGVWKDYKTIEFSLRANANQIIPGIKESNIHDFERRSDGFKRFVTFLLLISVNVKTDILNNALLLVDEPDTSLHPSGARYLRDELIRISRTNSVVYSTHSIFMIDPGDISRHYIVCKNKETTSIETAGESNFADEEVLYNAVGYSVFSVLKEKNIIFEGWNDKQLFQVALGSAAADIRKKYSGIGICHAKGTKSVKTITPMIELAGRECLIVSDSDSAAKDQQKIYRKEKGFGKWKTYQEIDPNIDAVTGEDFLKNSYLAKQIKNILPSSGISLSDLPATKGKIAVIKKLLITGGMTPEEAGDAIKQLKEICFEDLKASDIEPAYSKMLKALWTAL